MFNLHSYYLYVAFDIFAAEQTGSIQKLAKTPLACTNPATSSNITDTPPNCTAVKVPGPLTTQLLAETLTCNVQSKKLHEDACTREMQLEQNTRSPKIISAKKAHNFAAANISEVLTFDRVRARRR